MADKTNRRIVYRDAVTGMFVSREYAEAHPETTVAHRYEAQP